MAIDLPSSAQVVGEAWAPLASLPDGAALVGDGACALSILLVDDEIRLRQTIARSLTARGFCVDEAETCHGAIEAASSGRYDLMLLDVNLPDATGWDALRELAVRGLSLPTVVLSAVPPSASRVREFRPFGVLHKPFPMEALLRLVRSIEEAEGPDSDDVASEGDAAR